MPLLILCVIGTGFGADSMTLLLISLAMLWYMALKVEYGSKHCDNRDDMCCLWNLP